MIDWNRVHELREEVGHDDFLEVVDIFVEEVEEVITRLRRAPNPATYEDDLHFLKGSALNLGFEALSKQCQKGETLAAAGKTEGIGIAAVLAIYEESKIEFMEGLAEDKAA